LPGQVVLVLQGGGALGAYQVGVYQALHEAGVEPDWVIGTSSGAVNGAIIAGNETEKRLPRLHEFWDKVRLGAWVEPMAGPWANHWYANLSTYIGGIPGFFMPRAIPWGGMYAPLGVYSSSWYRTEPLHATLAPLIDFELLKAKHTRLTVGAVNVKSGELRYFDTSRATSRSTACATSSASSRITCPRRSAATPTSRATPATAAAPPCTSCASSPPSSRRRLQQGHRLHAHWHHRALRGRLRRHAEDARAQALGEAGRPDGRRDHPSGRAAERTARTQLN